ncbi:MAG TPA: DUF1634 domain-containing protein [Bacteroidales bacterium]|nr:DUF1634 domain-containing protein [Bacteroidales bacterium]
MREGNNLNDEKMRNAMGWLLRIGVIISAILVLIGGILFFIQHPHETRNYSVFAGEPDRFRSVSLILDNAIHFKGRAVIQLGLLVLIATPVIRVFFSLLGFLIAKDWIYVVITLIVMIILLNSLFAF